METTLPRYIDVRDNRAGQPRPYIAGTRVRVQDVVRYHERLGMSSEQIVQELPHLTLAQVHAAMLFYFEDREAIWKCIREDEAFLESLRGLDDSADAKSA